MDGALAELGKLVQHSGDDGTEMSRRLPATMGERGERLPVPAKTRPCEEQ